MTKVFFSFLGTSPYVRCNYGIAGRWWRDVRFVQTATLHLECSDWGPGDRVVVGCTRGASERNLALLRAELRASAWGIEPEVMDLPDATSEAQLWTIFQKVLDAIGEGDELVFDVTHSFRSLPMLFTVLLQYLRVVRGVRLRGVYYGAFERLGRPNEVEAMPAAERNAPIIDLTPFLVLYDWSAGIDHFLRFGSAADLERLVQDHITPILRDSRGADDNAKALRGLVKELLEFTRGAQYVRGKGLGGIAFQSRVVQPLRRIREGFLPPLAPVLERLAAIFADWPDQSPDNVLRTVGWCIDHDLVQQGITLLQEAIVDSWIRRCADLLEGPSSLLPVGRRYLWRRDFVSSLLAVLGQPDKCLPERWEGELKKHRSVAELCAARLPGKLAAEYGKLTGLRNDVNHGGYLQPSKWQRLRDGLRQGYAAIVPLLAAEEDVPVSAPPAGRTYFVTRHPGARAWAEARGLHVDRFIDHLDVDGIASGDVVVGSLPVNLAAEVCERGGRYLHLTLELPRELRGRELTADAMREYGARVEEYRVERKGREE